MAKTSKNQKILNPLMMTLAAMTAWAALNEPARFDVGNIGVWSLEALAVALLTRAGLALLTPLLGVFGVLLQRAVQDMRGNGAES
jgi:hypothetical protein